MKLTFIQDVATPHTNVLLAALRDTKGLKLDLWYGKGKADKYGWKDDIAHAVQRANLFELGRVDWTLVWHVFRHPENRVMLIGWSNPTTRALFLMLCLLRRNFGMWFDMPQDTAPRSAIQKKLRDFFYMLLRTSNATVFAVGQMTVDYFKVRNFWASQLVNLPIIVEVSHTRKHFEKQKAARRKRYNVGKNDVLIVGGSRLIHDKGFDLPISAIGALPASQKKRVKLVIVGQGEELDNLKKLAARHGLSKQVFFPGWMAYDDFQALISAGECFIHPARFDAWGSTIFAHALGVPVIGSTGAGSAFDRIAHGKNGWLFNPAKPAELTKLLGKLLAIKPAELEKMGKAARKTAEEWKPAQGVKTIMEHLA
ncbi:MAG TPA: glycosyltransferase [Alphaproteobacteria bacterium]|nr:glycosyltransferase [Alphaproteobacteria bacterium]